jgi:flagella basal body P-ring formation protein FlgA
MKVNLALVMGVVTVLSSAALAEEKAAVRVYLPRAATVEGAKLTLGALAVIQCEDSAIVAKAGAVEMGRTPEPGEKIVIDRQTVLTRLGSSGIDSTRVQFSGAESVSLVVRQAAVSAGDLAKVADEFVATAAPCKGQARWKPVKPAREAMLASAQDITFEPRLAKDAPAGTAKVEIGILSEGREVAVREAVYQCVYACRRAVAAKDIPANAALNEANVSYETYEVPTKPAEESLPAAGVVALRSIRAGEVIRADMTAKPGNAKEVLVRCNQTVTIRLAGAGFALSAAGQALQDGKAGDMVKVRNVDTKRIITARVTPDGKVEPVSEEMGK